MPNMGDPNNVAAVGATGPTGLSGYFGDLFGYGPGYGARNAAGQLAGQGIAGPALPNLSQESQSVAQQQQLLNQLQGMAAGTGPSAAQGQLSSGIQQAIAAQGAAAAGGRYGQNAALRQTAVANQGANLMAGGANQAGNMRAQEMQMGAQGAASVAGQMTGQALQAAGMQQAGQQAYNNQLANQYGAEQGQQAQAGQNLQGSAVSAAGSAAGVGAMAHGGVEAPHMSSGGLAGILAQLAPYVSAAAAHGSAGSGLTQVGERGPELLASADPNEKPSLITHPMLLNLGQQARDVVLPLKKGSAPYQPGPTPMTPSPRPTTPAPQKVAIKGEAQKAMAGKGQTHSPGPGAAGLSPKTAPVVAGTLAKHGMVGNLHPSVLAMVRAHRALQHAAS
jgi:hypothetical protein